MLKTKRLLALLALFALATVPATAAVEENASFNTDRLTVRNLIGEVRIEGHGGSDFDVSVRIRGRDAKAGLIRLDKSDDELQIVFPQNQSDYVYPALGDGKTSLSVKNGGWISRLLGTGRIEVRGSGSGLELWADVTILVPRGAELTVEQAVGRVLADGVDGDLELSTRSGDVAVEQTSGDLAVATGSGDVTAVDVRGDRINIATGSGEVAVKNCDGDRIAVATGSGDIELDSVQGRSAQLATGSGDITVDRS